MLPTLVRKTWHDFRRYDQMIGISKIARRYFVLNAFDGNLTVLGLIIGSWIADIKDPATVLRTGYSVALAIGVSGFTGAHLTETAERKDDLQQLSRQTLTDLGGSALGRASKMASMLVALINGISPSLAASFVLTPFFLASALGGILWCYRISLAVAFVLLFVLGVYLGSISGERLIWSGIKMLLAGIICVALSSLLR